VARKISRNLAESNPKPDHTRYRIIDGMIRPIPGGWRLKWPPLSDSVTRKSRLRTLFRSARPS
jgi:hypothetical protein